MAKLVSIMAMGIASEGREAHKFLTMVLRWISRNDFRQYVGEAVLIFPDLQNLFISEAIDIVLICKFP